MHLPAMRSSSVVFEVADLLDERGITFLVAASYGADLVPASHRGRPFLTKPFPLKSHLGAVAGLCPVSSGEVDSSRRDSRPSSIGFSAWRARA